jgi:crotonobetainyl-CoA:carnitine CoA-transferase CaiB-like acyl-CoA transferase
MDALSGIKVLELSRVLAGPWCGMLLADLGADVIKLEPFEGDDTRGLGPPYLNGMSAYFACCNRNKRSMAIDLRAPASRPLIEALVRDADVLIENYRTGTAETLHVDYESLSKINPRLIYCSISGYGRSGPGADRAGYDYVVQAEAGLMSITGPRMSEPSKVGVAVADLATGQNAAIAILAALHSRHSTGKGQRIDLSLFDTQLTWLANVASNVLFTGTDAPRCGNAHPSIVPYQAFKASDDEFVLAVASEKLWVMLCETLNKQDWLRDARFESNRTRVLHREILCELLASEFIQQPRAYWLDLFETSGIPAAPINSVQQALEHEVARARGMRISIEEVPMVGSAFHLSTTPVTYRRPPPKLGEHTNEILQHLNMDASALRKQGAVR